jgi:hypothetical protein
VLFPQRAAYRSFFDFDPFTNRGFVSQFNRERNEKNKQQENKEDKYNNAPFGQGPFGNKGQQGGVYGQSATEPTLLEEGAAVAPVQPTAAATAPTAAAAMPAAPAAASTMPAAATMPAAPAQPAATMLAATSVPATPSVMSRIFRPYPLIVFRPELFKNFKPQQKFFRSGNNNALCTSTQFSSARLSLARLLAPVSSAYATSLSVCLFSAFVSLFQQRDYPCPFVCPAREKRSYEQWVPRA